MANENDVEVTVRTNDKTAQGVKSAESNFTKLKGTLNDVATELTGFNLAQLSVAGAVGLAANEARKAIDEYSGYVDSIRAISIATGVTAEETSRLVQAADDLRISQGTVETAMRMAAQNGIVPSIDNIAKLADEYQAIQDPSEKAEFLTRRFGRSWTEIAPFIAQGGDAIRANTAAVSDSLAVTDAAIRKNNEYKASVDNLLDAWQGVKNEFAGEMLPGLAGSLNIFADNIEDLRNGVPIFEILAENQRRYALLEEESSAASQAYAGRLHAQAEASQLVTNATRAMEDVQNSLSSTMRDSTGNADAAKYAMEGYFATLKGSSEAANAAGKVAELKNVIDELAQAQDAARQASNNLVAAQKNWKESTANDVQRALEEAGVQGQQFTEGLGAIDEAYGTSLVVQEQYQKDVAAVVKQYKDGTINAEAFKKRLVEIKDVYMPLNDQVKEATERLKDFWQWWEAIRSKKVRLEFEIGEGGGKGGGSYAGAPSADKSKNKGGVQEAYGGPVAQGGLYTWNENPATRPETFVAAESGYILTKQDAMRALAEGGGGNGGGGVNIYGSVTVVANDPMDFYGQLRALGEQAKLAKAAGAQYAGGGR